MFYWLDENIYAFRKDVFFFTAEFLWELAFFIKIFIFLVLQYLVMTDHVRHDSFSLNETEFTEVQESIENIQHVNDY